MASKKSKGNTQFMTMSAVKENDKEMQFLVGGDPMVRLIKDQDHFQYVKQGYNIPYMSSLHDIDDVKEALKAASKISATGGVTLLVGESLTLFGDIKSFGKSDNELIQKQIEELNAEGGASVIITNPPGKISIRKHKEPMDGSQEEGDNSIVPPTGPNNQFLKAPMTDDQLTEALKTAVAALLNDEHKARMRWKDNEGYHEKEYGVNHLLICLFYYIEVRAYNQSSSFFWRQRTQFHDYFSEHLPEDISICSERYFRICIHKLQWKSCGFDEYIRSGKKPQVEWEKGQFNVEFWYAIYRKASQCYDEFFQKKMQK